MTTDTKQYGECVVMRCQCFNVIGKEPMEVPTVEGVYSWRDCLLCLLAEILGKIKIKEEEG